jgi:4-hydroxythreonine-4-phosphate dehydrogenase/1,2-dihydroxy-3,5-cyclohexadiene-1,4-dicarboxylate dehydrogenase
LISHRVARVAMPVGDPNGIGPEIALRTVEAYLGRDDVEITLFGPEEVLERAAQRMSLGGKFAAMSLVATQGMPDSAAVAGQVNASAGAAAVDAATRAIEAAHRGEFDAIVAGPHHETSIARAGIPFSGYPSLVAQVCGQPHDSVFLLLVGGGLHIVHVTLHESVKSALNRLSPPLVIDATRTGVRAMTRFGNSAPRIALMGINPHAGESGLFGEEDAAITEPAAAQLRADGLDVTGPAGGDMLLASRAHDLYVAIFHDQGHIPIKLLSPQGAAAISIGANVLFSTVGHGSAMDIAGKGVASPRAMIRTVGMLANVPLPPSFASDAA